MTDQKITRREFLGTAAKAGAAASLPLIVPRHVLGGAGYQAPSDTVNVAGVGVGGVGSRNIDNVAESENIVALADIDHDYASDALEAHSEAAHYTDYRRMFDEMGHEIDAVMIATPDHTHAKITADAMRRGMHVYTQKPLTWSVAEARRLHALASETDVVTQMGNQGHSSDDARLVNEYVRSGAIGTVNTIHVWTNRPIWPQGMEMPDAVHRLPDQLAWDLFLGPAPDEPYHEDFHPFSWRGWVEWGTGSLGDMGAHLIDHPYWALELEAPETIQTRSTPFNGASWPQATTTYYRFPARGDRPPVEMTWYDGGLQPERPEALPDDRDLPAGGGVLYVGDEGLLLHENYGENPQILPTEKAEEVGDPPQQFERVENESHEMNWIRAIRGEAEATCPFSYAAPLTETMLLGLVSLRADQQKLRWDADAGTIPNVSGANEYLARKMPREAWALEGARETVEMEAN